MKMNGKKVVVLVVLLFAVCLAFWACDNGTTPPEPVTFSVVYYDSGGGKIEGEWSQSIEKGKDAVAVTAVPSEGYLFAGWSDGKYSGERQDKNITADSEVTAAFVSKSKTFNYKYNDATANTSVKSVTVSYDDIQAATFAIPQKESYLFDGWYLDPELTIKVTDGKGFYYLGYSIFYYDAENLYAKWIKPEDINATFKVLMVFVDELHATLTTAYGTDVDVDYKMSLIEQKICELIPKEMEKTINDWFQDYSVTFEFDTYFTTTPLGYDVLTRGEQTETISEYYIWTTDIPEIGLLLDNYRSAMTTFGMNDYDHLFRIGGGLGSIKYATSHMETILEPLLINHIPLEHYLTLNTLDWDSLLDHYFHEFTHTVEQKVDYYDYHATGNYYSYQSMWGLEVTRLYLLHQAVAYDETLGVPFTFWRGEQDVWVSYKPSAIDGRSAGRVVLAGEPWEVWQYDISRQVPFGSGLTVEAIASEGNRFLKWSDGVTTAVRHDENIISILSVTAIFVKE